MGDTAFAIDVRLREIEPPIWRALELSAASTLEDLHYAIQTAMGWSNSHLHQFEIGGKRYGMMHVDEHDPELLDERRYRLPDVLGARSSFVYEYDFGDGWEHDVMVTSVTTASKTVQPRCTGGARACPPEDCGGPGGYATMLEALADPSHEEHETYVSWTGNFRPERFDLPAKGRGLREDMADLRALAEEGDVADDDNPLADVPPDLVQAVLDLEPFERAALAALLAGSLANELIETKEAAMRLAGALEQRRGGGHSRRGHKNRR